MNSRTVVATCGGRTYEIPEAWVVGFCTGAKVRNEPSSVLDAVAWWAWADVSNRTGGIGMNHKLPIIGHERFIIDKFTKALHDVARSIGDYTPIRDTPRGDYFEVRLANGRIARVTVELDRIEESNEQG